MEREEQIKQAAIERGCIEGTAEYFGFIQGARYADQNPTSPWKDASVEKPPYDPDCDDETSVYVMVRQEQGNVLEAYYDYDNNDWRDRDHNWRLQDPTHWMFTPEV